MIFVKVDETFTMIWLSRSSEIRVKVRRWPQSPFGTIFLLGVKSGIYDWLVLLFVVVIVQRSTCHWAGFVVRSDKTSSGYCCLSWINRVQISLTFFLDLTFVNRSLEPHCKIQVIVGLSALAYNLQCICLGWGADLHMAQLMPLPFTVSCSSKSRLVFYNQKSTPTFW